MLTEIRHFHVMTRQSRASVSPMTTLVDISVLVNSPHSPPAVSMARFLESTSKEAHKFHDSFEKAGESAFERARCMLSYANPVSLISTEPQIVSYLTVVLSLMEEFDSMEQVEQFISEFYQVILTVLAKHENALKAGLKGLMLFYNLVTIDEMRKSILEKIDEYINNAPKDQELMRAMIKSMAVDDKSNVSKIAAIFEDHREIIDSAKISEILKKYPSF
jgi:hypothetical protein